MDKQLEILGQVVERLEEVRAFKYPELPHGLAAVLLRFGRQCFVIGVDDSTDEILFLNSPPADAVEVPNLPALEFLNRAVGRRPGWICRLENQQGYFEGLQFYLILDEPSEPPFVFQLEAAASCLYLWQCSQIQA